MTFYLLGIEIYISFLFVMLISIIVFFDSTGYIIPTLLATFLHEIAHLAAMILSKSKPCSIKLIPAGVIITKKFAISHKADSIILLSGPLANLILSMIFFNTLPYFSAINFIVGVFNLLPVRGLDGGELLFMLLCVIFGESKTLIILKLLNIILGLVFCLFGVLLIFYGKINLSIIIIGIYILLSVIVKL